MHKFTLKTTNQQIVVARRKCCRESKNTGKAVKEASRYGAMFLKYVKQLAKAKMQRLSAQKNHGSFEQLLPTINNKQVILHSSPRSVTGLPQQQQTTPVLSL